jgi:hypothetical protein
MGGILMNIQGFEIIEQIAEGSMGTVWKTQQKWHPGAVLYWISFLND